MSKPASKLPARKDLEYILKRHGRGWSCTVRWSVAVGHGANPEKAMQDWINKHNKLIPKGNRGIK